MHRLELVILLLAAVVVLPVKAEPVRVVASFSILEDWVKIVGGEHVTVASLVGRNSDAHAFRPAPSDAKTVAGADLLVINGLGFEGWMPRLIEASGYRGEVLVASHGIETVSSTSTYRTLNHGEGIGHLTKSADPHAWHSFGNAMTYVRNIARGLSLVDPDNSDRYASNADRYIAQLKDVQADYVASFSVVPKSARKIVTSHSAFLYLAKDYDVELLTPQSGTAGIGSSAKRVARLVERIRHDNIRALFLENVVDPRMLEQVSQETGVAIGGRLYSDALSLSDGEAPSYLLMVQHNLDAILNALR